MIDRKIIFNYSPAISVLGLSFSLYSIVYLYILGSFLWIASGLAMIFSLIALSLNVRKLISILGIENFESNSSIILRLIFLCGFCSNSIYGLFSLIINLPVRDVTVFFIPSIITSILLIANGLELFKI